MMASLRAGMLADAPKRSTHWLTLELAWRAYGLSESPTRAHETEALDGAVKTLLGRVAADSGVDAALAVADSVSAALRDPTFLAVLNANRYRLTADERPQLARGFAGRLLDSPQSFHSWRILNELGVDIRNRGLDYDLALDLCEWAISLAPTRSDSQTSLSSIGWIHHLTGDEEAAIRSLERSVSMLDEAPTLGPSAVRRLLEVYEATGDLDSAIDLVASIAARAVNSDDDALGRLEELLTKAGRDLGEIPSLVAERRYSGVHKAPDFSGTYLSGDEFTLSEMRGSIVLLCFWSYG
jgi:tetratricopeptide (TPR) repeat protein